MPGGQNPITSLDHWPETEIVNNETKKLKANETKKLKAIETIWRDFYAGQRLEIWQKLITT